MTGKYMKRSEFLLTLRKVYEEDSTDYLLALRDGLSILIARRKDPSSKKLEDYEGWVKYV